MPFNEPDATDPMELKGVALEFDKPAAVREMAACFVEEYLRLGLSPGRVLEIFTHGHFAGPALALHELGESAIARLIGEYVQRRGPCVGRVLLQQQPDGALSLPVLEVKEKRHAPSL